MLVLTMFAELLLEGVLELVMVESFMNEPEGLVGWTRSSALIKPGDSVSWTVGGGVDDFPEVMVVRGAGGFVVPEVGRMGGTTTSAARLYK